MKTLIAIICLIASGLYADTFDVQIIRKTNAGVPLATNTISIAKAKSDLIGNLAAHTDLIQSSIRNYVKQVKQIQADANLASQIQALREANQAAKEAIEAEQ